MNHTQTTGDTPKKVYCEDCKFCHVTGYCSPFRKVRLTVDDYYSPKHRVRKIKYGCHEMKTHNINNDCKHHRGKRE